MLGEQQALDPAVDHAGVPQAADLGHPAQVLPRREGLVGGEALGHPADHGGPAADRAPARAQDAGGELEQGRLAGAVAAEHHDGAARRHGRVDLAQRPAGAAGVPEPDLLETHDGKPATRKAPGLSRGPSSAIGAGQSSAPLLRFFTTFGSTGTPGPMVVVTVTFRRYLPLAADGLARSTSSSTAA